MLDVLSLQNNLMPAATDTSVSLLIPKPPPVLGLQTSDQLQACILLCQRKLGKILSKCLMTVLGNLKEKANMITYYEGLF